MSRQSINWDEMAADFERGMRRDLGSQTRSTMRVRGRPQSLAEATRQPDTRSQVVVVVVPGDEVPSTEEMVVQRLQQEPHVDTSNLDLYYVMQGKHWSALTPRQLNPDDPTVGADHKLLLRNLAADVVLMPAGQPRPDWSDPAARIIN